MEDYLKSNGLYPSSTYFYLRTQPRHLSNEEFEDSHGIPPMKLESAPTANTLFPPGKNNAEALSMSSSRLGGSSLVYAIKRLPPPFFVEQEQRPF